VLRSLIIGCSLIALSSFPLSAMISEDREAVGTSSRKLSVSESIIATKLGTTDYSLTQETLQFALKEGHRLVDDWEKAYKVVMAEKETHFIPVIHGCSKELSCTYDMYSAIYGVDEKTAIFRTNRFFKDGFGMANLLKLIDDIPETATSKRKDHVPEYFSHALCINLSLFSDLEIPVECAFSYWKEGRSCKKSGITPLELIKGVVKEDLSRTLGPYKSRKLAKLVKYAVRAAPNTGVLCQIFLNPEIVNDCLLISKSSGVPLETWVVDKRASAAKTMLEYLTSDPISFSTFMKENQGDFLETDGGWTCRRVDGQTAKMYTGETVKMKPWHIQGRLLLDPELMSDPTKVYVKKYYWDEPSETELDVYRSKLKALASFVQAIRDNSELAKDTKKNSEKLQKLREAHESKIAEQILTLKKRLEEAPNKYKHFLENEEDFDLTPEMRQTIANYCWGQDESAFSKKKCIEMLLEIEIKSIENLIDHKTSLLKKYDVYYQS